MRLRLQRFVGAGILAVVLSLTGGAAVAAAQTVSVLLGAVHNPGTGTFEDSLSGAVSVATQDTAQGWYAYSPAYYNGELTAISMADPTNPAITGEGAPPNGGVQLYGGSTVNISGGVAYVASKNLNGPCPGAASNPPNLTGCSNNYAPNGAQYGNALSLFDVATNPAVPRFLGSISDASTGGNTLFGAYGVAAATIGGHKYALVAAQGCLAGQPCPANSGGDDLDVINVDYPASPTLVGTAVNSVPSAFTNDLKHATAVAVSGNYAYVTAFNGQAFSVIDISNPAAPKPVAEIRNATYFPLPSDVAIEGSHAYVINQDTAGGQGTLTVVDIANPLQPAVVGSVKAASLEAGYRIRVSGNLAWVAAHGTSAVTTVDIATPTAPTVLSTAVSKSNLNAVTGLDLMNIAGNEYAVGSSPNQPSDGSHIYPPFPSYGNTAQMSTGTITALELETSPANTAPPKVTGRMLAGRTLKAKVGTWTGTAPLSYAYQWQRCDKHGANCSILKTSTQTYSLGLSDLGHRLRVVVKATNGAGSLKATSATAAVVTVCPAAGRRPAYCARPKALRRPTVAGTTKVGQALVANPGRWSKLPHSTFASAQTPTTKIRWLRCDASGKRCRVIARATHATYKPTNADLKRRLKLEVIARNRNGSTIARSTPSAPIVSPNTAVTLALKVSRQPDLVRHGFVVASVQTNVGALVDVFVAITRVEGGSRWTTGTPVEARPGVPLKFKVVLSRKERRRLRLALSAHKTLTAQVMGVRFISPGHNGFQQTAPQRLTITG
jgi:hypothetical protein